MKRVFFVTGGIASGKSSFIQMAMQRGFACISADKVAHQILEQNGRELGEYLGISSFLQDGAVNRKKLGELVFNDKSLRKKLENFMHPKIYAIITAWLAKQNGVVFAEIPLFFESKNYEHLGKVILIYAPKELCLKRLMARNDLNLNEANLRIKAQIDIEQKRKLADIIIENIGSNDEFKAKCTEFFEKLKA